MKQNPRKTFLSKMENRFTKKIVSYPKKDREGKVNYILKILAEVTVMLHSTSGFEFNVAGYAVLKWKLAQYLQPRDAVHVDDLYESLIMFPHFLDDNLERLEKAIALFRKQRKDTISQERKRALEHKNAASDVIATDLSGSYRLEQLTSWLHLIQESEVLDHCIGDSDFYARRMSTGEYVVYSLRDSDGLPVATLVYSTASNTIEQIRKHSDVKIGGNESWLPALLEFIQAIGDIHSFSDQEPFIVNEKELVNLSDEQKAAFKMRPGSDLYTVDGGQGDEILKYQIKPISIWARELLNELDHRNYWIPAGTQEFWEQYSEFSDTALGQTSNLVALNLDDLGLDDTELFTYEQVCESAEELGYKLCSISEACASILQFPVEPDYCFHFFGMKLLNDEGMPSFFATGNNAEQKVFFVHGQETQWFSTEQCLEYDYRFIFKTSKRTN